MLIKQKGVSIMWNDLVRRWMKLAFWWVPGNQEPQAPSQTRTPPPQATPQPPESARPSRAPESSGTPKSASSGGDLTGIKGIGPAMQTRLTELGITTKADLAAAEPATLTKQLKAGRAVVSESKVRAWIEAAAGY